MLAPQWEPVILTASGVGWHEDGVTAAPSSFLPPLGSLHQSAQGTIKSSHQLRRWLPFHPSFSLGSLHQSALSGGEGGPLHQPVPRGRAAVKCPHSKKEAVLWDHTVHHIHTYRIPDFSFVSINSITCSSI